jgi:hypothetical protein
MITTRLMMKLRLSLNYFSNDENKPLAVLAKTKELVG